MKSYKSLVSEIWIPTYPKTALHLSQPTDRFETKHDELTDCLLDLKQKGLTALLQGYPDT